jgi:uncharacterized membrane protein YeaQ/YmgE (transglycosylase-associated protein family)
MRALVGLVIALGLLWPVIGLIVGSMAGNLTLEDDSKWLEGLILGLAGRFDGAESQAQERRWGRQRRGTWPPMAGGINT